MYLTLGCMQCTLYNEARSHSISSQRTYSLVAQLLFSFLREDTDTLLQHVLQSCECSNSVICSFCAAHGAGASDTLWSVTVTDGGWASSQSGGGRDGGGEGERVELRITLPKEWTKKSEMVKYKEPVKGGNSPGQQLSTVLVQRFYCNINVPVSLFLPFPQYADSNDTWSTLSFSQGPLETAAFWITPPWFLRSAMAVAGNYGPGEKLKTRGIC